MQKKHLILTEQLVNIRKRHHYTQAEVAGFLNVSRQCYSHYESGLRTPDLYCLLQLSALYHTPIDELIHILTCGNTPVKPYRTALTPCESMLIRIFRLCSTQDRQEIIDISKRKYRLRAESTNRTEGGGK